MLGFFCAFLVLQADWQRRRLPGRPLGVFLPVAAAGLLGCALAQALAAPAAFVAHPVRVLLSVDGFAWFGGVLAGALALFLLGRRHRIPSLVVLDAAAPAAALGFALGRLGGLFPGAGDVPVPTLTRLFPLPFAEFVAFGLIFYYLWGEGRHAVQFQRPDGTVFGQYLVLTGAVLFLAEFLRHSPVSILGLLTTTQAASLLSVAAGGALLAWIVPAFLKGKEEHRIVRHVAERGEAGQPEYHAPTPECPHPERWRMLDSMTAEMEVLEFLKCLITTVKPQLVVETGTFMGISTLWIAEGLRQNGFGKVITCEYDPEVFARARQRIDASGLSQWVEYRNESSLETRIDATIDLLFSDSDMPIREQEVRRFLPQISPHGLILMHDASSQDKVVREAALKLEREGLLSVTLLPTPRGLVVAQKRVRHK